jgi:hypothetical protein
MATNTAGSNSRPLYTLFETQRETWVSWFPRFSGYLKSYNFKEDEYAQTLIIHLTPEPFTQLQQHIWPRKVDELSFDELKAALNEIHESSRKVKWTARSEFRLVTQQEGQSIQEFVRALRSAAKDCCWEGEVLEENLLESFIKGVWQENVRQKVHAMSKNYTKLSEAIKEAENIVSTINSYSMLAQNSTNMEEIHHLNHKRSGASRMPNQSKGQSSSSYPATDNERCYRCGRENHKAPDCFFKDHICQNCNKKGHLAAVCKSTQKQDRSNAKADPRKIGKYTQRNHHIEGIHYTDMHRKNFNQTKREEQFNTRRPDTKPIIIKADIEGSEAEMELDSGSGVSCMPFTDFVTVNPRFERFCTNDLTLCMANGQSAVPACFVEVTVKVNNKSKLLRLYLMDDIEFPLIFGRDWLRELQLDWTSIHKLNNKNSSMQEKSTCNLELLFSTEPNTAKVKKKDEVEDRVEKAISVFYTRQIEACPINREEIAKCTATDSELQQLIQGLQKEAKSRPRKFHGINSCEFGVEQGCVIRGERIVIPAKLQSRVLKELHKAHFGIAKMKAVARGHVWWSTLDADIKNMTLNCQKCLEHASDPRKAQVQPWKPTKGPWERLHIDFAGPFINQYFFIVVDSFSKWVEVKTMKRATAAEVIKFMRKVFARFGYPHSIISDNGSQFTSAEFKQFLRNYGIEQGLIAPYHPASNGQAERFVQTIKRQLKKMYDNTNQDVEAQLEEILLRMRNQPSSNGTTPSEIMFGRRIRDHMTMLHETPRKLEWQENEPSKFKVGEIIMARIYRSPKKKWALSKVKEILGPRNYKVEIERNITKRHINQMKKVGPNFKYQEEFDVDLIEGNDHDMSNIPDPLQGHEASGSSYESAESDPEDSTGADGFEIGEDQTAESEDERETMDGEEANDETLEAEVIELQNPVENSSPEIMVKKGNAKTNKASFQAETRKSTRSNKGRMPRRYGEYVIDEAGEQDED